MNAELKPNPPTLTTVLMSYRFDTSKPGDDATYALLVQHLRAQGLRRMHSHDGGRTFHYHEEWKQGVTVELDTAHLFQNQWVAKPFGESEPLPRHVYDWAEDYLLGATQGWIKQGHYLEQTDAMRELRQQTSKCGYCAAYAPTGTQTFCDQCLGSEHLTEKDLPLLRMRPVAMDWREVEPLTTDESAWLLPRYREAQSRGISKRDKKRRADYRARLVEDARKECVAARGTIARGGKHKTVALLWLFDAGLPIRVCENAIYYDHKNCLTFGWREPMPAEDVSLVLDVISEYPGAYSIKCADGRELDGGSEGPY